MPNHRTARRLAPLLGGALLATLVASCGASPVAATTDAAGDAVDATSGDAIDLASGDAGADAGDTPSGDARTAADNPQDPPTTAAALATWLAARSYERWHCEPAPHPARPFGAHGVNRICSNDRLAAHGAGEYPVGAASVKELYSGDVVTAWAVAVHHRAGTSGNDWYWYEGTGPNAYAGVGATGCTGCHAQAGHGRPGHDYVYTQVP
jgi:hypothetical protein